MKLWPFLALFLFIGGNVNAADTQNSQWPALPKTGFISGRPATKQDVAEGNAVFVAEKDGKGIGTALPIQIPQYAYWDDGKGHQVPVIVVQAEVANGMELFGILMASGGYSACLRRELTLLGQTAP